MIFLRGLIKTALVNLVINRVVRALKDPKNQKKAKKAYKNYRKRR